MRKIIINEDQEKSLVVMLTNPKGTEIRKYPVNTEKVKLVKKFLDRNFKKGQLSTVGKNGLPEALSIVAMIDGNGEVLKNLYKEQLEELLIDHFSNMFLDKDERGRFMKQVVKDWYENKIGVFGTLSRNYV